MGLSGARTSSWRDGFHAVLAMSVIIAPWSTGNV
jgi:hypothetical protein